MTKFKRKSGGFIKHVVMLPDTDYLGNSRVCLAGGGSRLRRHFCYEVKAGKTSKTPIYAVVKISNCLKKIHSDVFFYKLEASTNIFDM